MSQNVVFRVAGMDCGTCERRLQTVLGRLDGVGGVDADHAAGVVRVRFDPARVTSEALARQAAARIADAGFTVTGRDDDGQERS
jgi:copper chaperone CopZ